MRQSTARLLHIYVHKGDFERGIYKIIDSAYRIREKCDYSDFFIALKEEMENRLKIHMNFLDKNNF